MSLNHVKLVKTDRCRHRHQKQLQLKCLMHLLLPFLLCIEVASSQSVVESLPGYSGALPFMLETGYVSVGESDDIELFYYFIPSERNPDKDPLLLWLTGGPGCSAFSGLVYEIGPLNFDMGAFDGNLPSFLLNPYSWTKVASIIFLDWPVGTGFSYSATSESYYSSDTQSVTDIYTFLQKWLLNIHPNFIKNGLYIAGDSYGGKVVPLVGWEISKGNEAGQRPRMNLQGYLIGNSPAEVLKDENFRAQYAHRMAIISDEYYELFKKSCRGDYSYINPDPTDIECLYALRPIEACMSRINRAHILEPKCNALKDYGFKWDQMTPMEDVDIFLPSRDEPWCRVNSYLTSYVWANDPNVREALHVRNGSVGEWKRCNRSLSYDQDIESVLKYHQLLIQKEYQALVYSGDHDMLVPYIGTLAWIRELNLTVDDRWRAWTVSGQVAGFTERYKYKQGYLTFATVKGAGHTAPEYKPQECLAMIDRWLANYPL